MKEGVGFGLAGCVQVVRLGILLGKNSGNLSMSDQPEVQFKIPSVLEDPSIKAIARVYADALLDAQGDATGEDRVAEFQSFIEDVLDANPEFEAILFSLIISNEKKSASIDRIVSSQASENFGRFLKVVASHGRLDLLRVIYDVAADEQEKRSGKVRVIVRTASEITDEKRAEICLKLKNILSADPVLQVETDPSLIGGLVIQVGDTVYDNSLRNRLGQLQSQLRQRYVHEIQSGRNRFSYSEGS